MVAGIGSPTSFCGCREPGRFLTEECVVGCSLHSSGHVFSRASSDQREDNSHVPLVRLFRATQAWAILQGLQVHSTSQPRAPSTFQSGAERPHYAWGLMKLWCEWPWRYPLPWTPFPVSSEETARGGGGRAQAQDTHKACEISLCAETALKYQAGRVGSASWEGRSGAWQSREGDALTRTPYGPQPPLPAAHPSQAMPPSIAPRQNLPQRAPFTCIIPSILTCTLEAGITCPPFTEEETRLGDGCCRRLGLRSGSNRCALSVPSGSQMLSRLLYRHPPEPAGGSGHRRSDRQGLLLPNAGQIQSSTLAGEQRGSQQQWGGMAYSQAAEGHTKI